MQGVCHCFVFLHQVLPGPDLSPRQEFPTGHLRTPSLSGDCVEIPGHKKPKKGEVRPFWSPANEPLARVPLEVSWMAVLLLCPEAGTLAARPSPPAPSLHGAVPAALFPAQLSQDTACRCPPLTEPSKVHPAPVKAGLLSSPHLSLGPRVSPTLALRGDQGNTLGLFKNKAVSGWVASEAILTSFILFRDSNPKTYAPAHPAGSKGRSNSK